MLLFKANYARCGIRKRKSQSFYEIRALDGLSIARRKIRRSTFSIKRDLSQPKGRMVVKKDGERLSNCSKGNAIYTRVCSVTRGVQSTGEKKGKWMEEEGKRGPDGE